MKYLLLHLILISLIASSLEGMRFEMNTKTLRKNALNHDSAFASQEKFRHRLTAKPLKIEDSKRKHNPLKL